MIVGKAVICKALHKGDVNNRLTRAYRKPTVRIAEPLRNKDCSTATSLHLWQFINENKCVTMAWVQPELLTKIQESTTFESSVGK